ncbi:MAG: Fe-S protein assembly chaperone HscA [Burkholderiaceae bacterium]|nr:Fe-S protein assembly chaperone HscA [Burkholderiaceae bacterium]MDP4949073.1 Fe-S protein assembly chaperone HscA [Burkholderiaceae bacterium]
MALLQISEPGETSLPHQRRLAVGIDLGTTNSLVAAVRSGTPEVLKDENNRLILPSVVVYEADGAISVGDIDVLSQSTRSIVSSVKRIMGRSLSDVRAIRLPFELQAEDESKGMPFIPTVQGLQSPVEVSAEILKVLRRTAEKALADEIVGAVITVPAYFDDAQRQATKDAARLAGIHVFRLLNEPTAAALAYGLETGAEGTYVVFDLGGGTFDVSVLKLTKGVFEVVATGGDSQLGGDDFDRLLAQAWLSANGLSPDRLEHSQWRTLLGLARSSKEALLELDSDTKEISEVFELDAQTRLTLAISRQGFASLTMELVERALAACRQTLQDARLNPSDVQGVVMVGGSSRLLNVRLAVRHLFGDCLKDTIDPDQVVALGAASQAHLLAGNALASDGWLLLDVLALSLGIETMGGLAERILPRNTPIPVARAQEFTTFKDGQTSMAIHVVQGERETVADCRSLARFELKGIPPMVAGAARIRITFQVDADGLLQVSALETRSGVSAQIEVRPSYGLTDDEIASMLEQAVAHSREDMQQRAVREALLDLEQLLEAISAALEQDGDLLSAQERQALDNEVTQARKVCASQDREALVAASERLGGLADPFAERRMNRAVSQALTGQSIENL